MRETSKYGNQTYRPGDYYHECPVCGFLYLRSEMRERWDGQIVCEPDWEPRNEDEENRVHLKERPFKLR